MRDRAWRRRRAELKQEHRTSAWRAWGWNLDERRKGMARKTHFGCGCPHCKPWKHGLRSHADEEYAQERGIEDGLELTEESGQEEQE